MVVAFHDTAISCCRSTTCCSILEPITIPACGTAEERNQPPFLPRRESATPVHPDTRLPVCGPSHHPKPPRRNPPNKQSHQIGCWAATWYFLFSSPTHLINILDFQRDVSRLPHLGHLGELAPWCRDHLKVWAHLLHLYFIGADIL